MGHISRPEERVKNTRLFSEFLKETVNLNETRLGKLEDSSAAVERFIRASDWKSELSEWFPQGSWAHKTIIRPPNKGEFDADVLAIVKPVAGWTAEDYVDSLFNIFRASDRYRDKVKRFRYCITLNYAEERKMDIAPCVEDRIWNGTYEVCDRDNDEFQKTEPKEFTDWLIQANELSGSNSFRKATRLLKYLRDIKKTFTCSSVCLTTMLASFIYPEDKGSASFSDTPTALLTLTTRLDNVLQDHPRKPNVRNPFTEENFADCWTDKQYDNFRNMIHKYRQWIEDAYNEPRRNQSIRKWRRVFGPDFGKGEDLSQARGFAGRVAEAMNANLSAIAAFSGNAPADIVDFIKSRGQVIVPPEAMDLSYVEESVWPTAVGPSFRTSIRATVHRERGPTYGAEVRSGQPVRKGKEILFKLHLSTGMTINWQDFDIYWRVTNTGDEAADVDQLRGNFIQEHRSSERWESLSYRGVHFVEAFVVRKRDGILMSKSEPFIVVIE